MRAHVCSDAAVPGGNEDAAGILGDVAVMLDGAGVPPRFRAGCHHSVAWYSHQLAGRLLLRAQDPAVGLDAALAAAIGEVRSLHEDQCELERGGPSATVIAVRQREDVLEHLVLCDSSLLLTRADGAVRRLTDPRVDQVVARERGAEAIEAQRNRSGGFWVARHEEEAAAQALTGSTPLAQLERVQLVSDGITRAVDLLGLHDDASLVAALATDPSAVIAQIRGAERDLPSGRRPRKTHDDATVITVKLGSR